MNDMGIASETGEIAFTHPQEIAYTHPEPWPSCPKCGSHRFTVKELPHTEEL
jgi:hypothetical protein